MTAATFDPPARLSRRPAPRQPTGLDRPRRALHIAFGAVWLLDAALQCQPQMFGHQLATQVVAPSAAGSPAWVADPVLWTARLINQHTMGWDLVFVAVQLTIGLGLLSHRTMRAALLLSFGYSLGLWWFAEGFGGVLAGPVQPAAGLPGAAVLYAVLSVALWPAPAGARGRSVATRGLLRPAGTAAVWSAFWAVAAFEALRPADRAPSALHALVVSNEAGEPGWLRGVLQLGAAGVAHHGTEVSIASAALFVLIAALGLRPAGHRGILLAAMMCAVLIWVFGEALGGLATGRATDPNTGPLIVLLVVSVWPTRAPDLPPCDPQDTAC